MTTYCLRLESLRVYFVDTGLDTIEVVECVGESIDSEVGSRFPRVEARNQWKQLVKLGARRTA